MKNAAPSEPPPTYERYELFLIGHVNKMETDYERYEFYHIMNKSCNSWNYPIIRFCADCASVCSTNTYVYVYLN